MRAFIFIISYYSFKTFTFLLDTVVGQRREQVLMFIVWRIILRFQICGSILSQETLEKTDYNQAPAQLLRWVKHMVPNDKVTNFTSDWADGKVLCNLVNAIRPGAIADDILIQHQNNTEINVRLACTTAEDELGIPELIAPFEIANGMSDEKSMMIYLALFRNADRMINKTTYDSEAVVLTDEDPVVENEESAFVGVPHEKPKVVAFGSGLRWGQVGRSSEFFLQVNGPEFADLSISIECRPFDNRTTLYKPNLQIKAIDKTSYVVRYTPTRPGEYVLNVFCSGAHIPNSPFRLNISETVLSERFNDEEIVISFEPSKVTYTSSHLSDIPDFVHKGKDAVPAKDDSAFGDDDDLSSFTDSLSKSDKFSSSITDIESSIETSYKKQSDTPFEAYQHSPTTVEGKPIQISGAGLKSGEVGIVSSFHVCTPNDQKGPLNVSITCPALSIPVPSVKTYLHDTYLMHDVDYLPTEPGIYELGVAWGDTPIEGSPFFLAVSEINGEKRPGEKENVTKTKEARISYYLPKSKDNIIIYHSATTGDTNARVNKTLLETLLRENNPLDSVVCITIDLDLERIGRKKIFDKANSKKLPMVFVNDQYVGSHDDITGLYKQHRLKEYLLQYKSKEEC